VASVESVLERGSSAQTLVCVPLRVFVVENHDDTRTLLCMLFEQMGHTTFSAATMSDALRLIPQHDCDVLIADIGLPDGDGWELLRRLELPRPIYAVAVSGYGMNADRARSKAAGYRHHLVKPTGHEQLMTIIEKAAKEIAEARNAPSTREKSNSLV
jgi:CheY-like chemotaxis protein